MGKINVLKLFRFFPIFSFSFLLFNVFFKLFQFFSKFRTFFIFPGKIFSISKKTRHRRVVGGVGDGGGPWDFLKKGCGFEVSARLENSATSPSSIFLNLFPKISKNRDPGRVFLLLKMTSGPKQDIWSTLFFEKLENFHQNTYLLVDKVRFTLKSHSAVGKGAQVLAFTLKGRNPPECLLYLLPFSRYLRK